MSSDSYPQVMGSIGLEALVLPSQQAFLSNLINIKIKIEIHVSRYIIKPIEPYIISMTYLINLHCSCSSLPQLHHLSFTGHGFRLFHGYLVQHCFSNLMITLFIGLRDGFSYLIIFLNFILSKLWKCLNMNWYWTKI